MTGSYGYDALEQSTGYRLKVIYGQADPGPAGPPGDPGPPGADGADGLPVELRQSGEDVEWRVVGETEWSKLVALGDIAGPVGQKGEQGTEGPAGEDGPAIELALDGGYVVWRVEGAETWIQLIAVTELKGDKGETGIHGENGTGFVIKGQYNAVGDLPASADTDPPEVGDAYLVGTTVHLWGYVNGANTAEWIAVGDVTISQGVLDTLARKAELYPRQMRPGEKLTAFTDATDGDHTAGVAPVGTIEASADDGSVLRVTGQVLVATRERVALEDGRAYELRARARRVTDPADPANDAVTLHAAWLDEDLAFISSSTLAQDELSNNGVDDVFEPSVIVSRTPYTYNGATSVTPPAGAVYAVPYVRTYGADSVTDIVHVEMRDASVYSDLSRMTWPEGFVLPPEVSLGPELERIIFVSDEGGDNSNSGKSMGLAVKTIERAMELIVERGTPHAVEVLPGIYPTDGHIDVPDLCTGVVAATNSRSTKIVPTAGNEMKNVFRFGDGGYIEGFSFEGFQVDDLSDPSEGFAVSFRPGAVIRRAVFAFNITVFRAQPAVLVPPPVDREAGNPLVGNGPGVALADKSVVSQYSPFPQLMLWGATPVCPNGIGYCAKNGAFLNGINAVALWMHKHYLALSGGEIVLTNCASQFGDFSLWSEGSTQVVDPESTNATLVTDMAAADAVNANRQAIINQMWTDLQNGGYGAVDETATRKDAGIFLTSIEYDLRSGQQEGMQRFARGMFDYKGDFVAPASSVAAFVFAWESMRDQIKALSSVNAAADAMVDGIVQLVIDTVNSPVKRTKPSQITSVGHQWNNTMAGVNGRALDRPALPVRESIIERDLGTATWSGIDDLGNQYFPGGALVNPTTGKFEGPPVGRTIDPRARIAAIIAGGQ